MENKNFTSTQTLCAIIPLPVMPGQKPQGSAPHLPEPSLGAWPGCGNLAVDASQEKIYNNKLESNSE
jgi:hypothetical protein